MIVGIDYLLCTKECDSNGTNRVSIVLPSLRHQGGKIYLINLYDNDLWNTRELLNTKYFFPCTY